MATIKLKKLELEGACVLSQLVFKKNFGQEVEVTPEKAIECTYMFDWDWAARHLLNEDNYRAWFRVAASSLTTQSIRAREFAVLYIQQEG